MSKNILPAELTRLLAIAGKHLEKGESVATELPALIAEMYTLPALTINKAASQIAAGARLFIRHKQPSWTQKLLQQSATDSEQLSKLPNLQYLFLFHYDGRIREASLQRMDAGLQSPFWFAAVCLRLNDWAEPVRKAAFSCALRCFPITAPEVIAEGAARLTLSQYSWGRWGYERAAIDEALDRPDVIEQIAKIICEGQTGPISRVLRLLLKNNAIDTYLPRLAVNARQPAVRAMAVQVLAVMKASWPVGWEWKWIDKSMGQRVRVPTFASRDILLDVDRANLIHVAASDRAAMVRRAALDALICRCLTTDEAMQVANRLRTDPNASVRERAEFIISKSSERSPVAFTETE